jgi:hypothetical protein
LRELRGQDARKEWRYGVEKMTATGRLGVAPNGGGHRINLKRSQCASVPTTLTNPNIQSFKECERVPQITK